MGILLDGAARPPPGLREGVALGPGPECISRARGIAGFSKTAILSWPCSCFSLKRKTQTQTRTTEWGFSGTFARPLADT